MFNDKKKCSEIRALNKWFLYIQKFLCKKLSFISRNLIDDSNI